MSGNLDPAAAVGARAPRGPQKPPQWIGEVLLWFSGAWPQFEVTKATAEVWGRSLADCDPVIAQEVARMLVKVDTRFPTVARFRDHYRQAKARQLEEQRAATLALPEAVLEPDQALERIRAIRAARRGA